MRPLPGPPLSWAQHCSIFFFFQTKPRCLPATDGVSTESETTPCERKQTNKPQGCEALAVALLLLDILNEFKNAWFPTGIARIQSVSLFKLLELGSPSWTREGESLYDLCTYLHQQKVGSFFRKKFQTFFCLFIWCWIFFQVPFPAYLLLKIFFLVEGGK